MAIALNSFTPNTKAESAQVNTNFANLKSGVEDASYRAFSWGFVGGVAVQDTQGMQWICPQGVTVKTLYAKTTSGTCTIRVRKDGVDIHAGYAVTSTATSTAVFSADTINAGQIVTLDVTVSSPAIDLYVMLETMPTTIA